MYVLAANEIRGKMKSVAVFAIIALEVFTVVIATKSKLKLLIYIFFRIGGDTIWCIPHKNQLAAFVHSHTFCQKHLT